MQELIYTSAPKGLRLGSRGFCTVASTPGMATPLAERLEALSGYKHLYPPGSENAPQNPVNYSFVTFKLGGKTYYVLSRIADAGLDYTQRSNKLAHHVVLEGSELPPGGPAWLMSQPGFFVTKWDDEPRVLGSRQLPSGGPPPLRVCSDWHSVTGDAGWAGVLADSLDGNDSTQANVVFPVGTELLTLVQESQSLLGLQKRWAATFSTYYSKLPPGTDCRWRFIPAGTPESVVALRSHGTLLIDISARRPVTKQSTLVKAARSGNHETAITIPDATVIPATSIEPDATPTPHIQLPALNAPPALEHVSQLQPPLLPRRRSSAINWPEGKESAETRWQPMALVAIAAFTLGLVITCGIFAWRHYDVTPKGAASQAAASIKGASSDVSGDEDESKESSQDPASTQSLPQPPSEVVEPSGTAPLSPLTNPTLPRQPPITTEVRTEPDSDLPVSQDEPPPPPQNDSDVVDGSSAEITTVFDEGEFLIRSVRQLFSGNLSSSKDHQPSGITIGVVPNDTTLTLAGENPDKGGFGGRKVAAAKKSTDTEWTLTLGDRDVAKLWIEPSSRTLHMNGISDATNSIMEELEWAGIRMSAPYKGNNRDTWIIFTDHPTTDVWAPVCSEKGPVQIAFYGHIPKYQTLSAVVRIESKKGVEYGPQETSGGDGPIYVPFGVNGRVTVRIVLHRDSVLLSCFGARSNGQEVSLDQMLALLATRRKELFRDTIKRYLESTSDESKPRIRKWVEFQLRLNWNAFQKQELDDADLITLQRWEATLQSLYAPPNSNVRPRLELDRDEETYGDLDELRRWCESIRVHVKVSRLLKSADNSALVKAPVLTIGTP
jgi:hypothetical protein